MYQSIVRGIYSQKKVETAAAPSITLEYESLEFDWDGTPLTSATVVITANGAWTSTQVDLGQGTFGSCEPTSAAGNSEITVYCTENSGAERQGRISFNRGGAVANLSLYQYGNV